MASCNLILVRSVARLFFATAVVLVASSSQLFGQGHVIMTPELVEANRKFTTYAPMLQYPASALRRNLQGSGVFLLHVRGDGTKQAQDFCTRWREQRLQQSVPLFLHPDRI